MRPNVLYSCLLQGKSTSGERTVVISLRDKDRKYLSGHVIGGRNLFPGVGYLVSCKMQYVRNVVTCFPYIDVIFFCYFPH
jgi:hypothetical protein